MSSSLPAVPPNSPSSTPEPLSASPKLSSGKRALVAILLFLGVALSVANALLWSRGVWTAEVSGYAIGTLIIPSVAAYLIAGREKHRKPVGFGLIFAGITLLLCLMELPQFLKNPNAEIAQLMRVASDSRATDRRSTFSSPSEKLLLDVMTEFLDKVKVHNQKVHELHPDLQTLYTPESFSSSSAMSRASDSVERITALDHELVLQLEQWPSRVQEQTAQSALSASDKQSFLKGYNQSFSNSEILTSRRQVDQIELQWCKDTLALYDFARSHRGGIRVKESHILIEDQKIRTQFNDLLQQSREQRQRMLDANTQLAKLQKDALQRFGLTRKDIGLSESSSPTTK